MSTVEIKDVWRSKWRSGVQLASRTVRRFVLHPIWSYSIPHIFRAVQRDWDGPVGAGAREILGEMAKRGTRVMTIEFSENGIPFLELECTARLPQSEQNDGGEGRQPARKGL